MKQIPFYGKFQPTGVDTSGAQRLQALAGLSSQVGDIAFQVGAKQRQKEGELAGAKVQRDEEGNIVAPEMKSDLTIFGESFNRKAVLAYKAQIGLDAKARLEELQNEYKNDPEGYKQQADAAKSGALNGMPPEIADEAALEFDVRIANHYSTLKKDFYKRETEAQQAKAAEWVESKEDDILNAARGGDESKVLELIALNNSKLDSFIEERLIGASKAVQIKENLKERILKQEALGEIDRVIFNDSFTLEDKVTKGVEFLEELQTQDFEDLDPDQKDALERVVGAKVASLQSQLNKKQSQRSLEHSRIISDLEIAASTGTGDPAEIVEKVEDLFNREILKESERTSILTKLGNKYKKDQKQHDLDELAFRKINGEKDIIIPQKDVNSFYDRNLKNDIDKLEPELKTIAQADIITKLRAVPSSVKQQIQNGVLSGDVELIKQQADLVSRIDDIPGLFDLAVTSNQAAFVEQVVALSESIEPEEAIRIAKENTDPNNKARVDAREYEIKSEKYRAKYTDKVEDSFESFFGDDYLVDNINKSHVEQDYKDLFEGYFKNGMSKDKAEEKALKILHANWKDSQFGFMKYPPEDYYSVGGHAGYIKSQLSRELTLGNIGLEYDKDDIYLISDEETARRASLGVPNYKVVVFADGALHSIDGRWSPDVGKEKERQIQENVKPFEDLTLSTTSQLESIN